MPRPPIFLTLYRSIIQISLLPPPLMTLKYHFICLIFLPNHLIFWIQGMDHQLLLFTWHCNRQVQRYAFFHSSCSWLPEYTRRNPHSPNLQAESCHRSESTNGWLSLHMMVGGLLVPIYLAILAVSIFGYSPFSHFDKLNSLLLPPTSY